jgi:dimethylargininase
MRALIALTRAVSPAFGDCELTHLERQPIDVARAIEEHKHYEHALEGCGCRVHQLRADETMPDSVFIEDTAVVLDEVAIVTWPGASSRRGEVPAVAAALSLYRPLHRMAAPATMDGGDVIVAGRTIFVGLSTRTNAAGVASLRMAAEPLGYEVRPVEVQACLHLKSAATAIDEGTVLVSPTLVAPDVFRPLTVVAVDAREPGAANVARVGDWLVASAAFPRTRARLEREGYRVRSVEVGEIAKAEGAVTCCSLVFSA